MKNGYFKKKKKKIPNKLKLWPHGISTTEVSPRSVWKECCFMFNAALPSLRGLKKHQSLSFFTLLIIVRLVLDSLHYPSSSGFRKKVSDLNLFYKWGSVIFSLKPYLLFIYYYYSLYVFFYFLLFIYIHNLIIFCFYS